MSSVIENNGGAGSDNSGEMGREQKKLATHANTRKGCMKGKGGPLNPLCTFKGVRQRTWGRWVSEIRNPKHGNRLWLGTFNSAREAAMAYDAAARALFGPNAPLNLPDEVPPSPPPTSLTASQCFAVAIAEASLNNNILHEFEEFQNRMQLQMYMNMLHMHLQQEMLQMDIQDDTFGVAEYSMNSAINDDDPNNHPIKIPDHNVTDVVQKDLDYKSIFNDLKPNLPEFDDSHMWEEAASTLDFHQAFSDPGIAAWSFDDEIGINLKHPLIE